ncbi:hypothetical protein V498_07330 [Pseudogymnoascus sp. VKM F-4517 (FW-2822)]|nr:hypothetical protein V498_07330 [Pseudogymnoascus sp. VKM F-4517 (FW-2822)]
MASVLKSRALGSIWGVCVCDALGGPVQFLEQGSFEPIKGMEYVTPFQQPAGSYSDDGAMTQALAQSFIDSRGQYNHELSIEYFGDWLKNGRFSTTSYPWDVGLSTRVAVEMWRTYGTGNLEGTQRQVDTRLASENRSGNGSLMRIAPIGVVMWKETLVAQEIAVRQGRVTHPALACLEACEVYTDLLCRAMKGENKEQLCQALKYHQLKHNALVERLAQYSTLADWVVKSSSNISSSGWVVDTLEVALWGLFKYDSFAEGALAVVNLGGDSDTAGAVYGGIAGAIYGYESIPGIWIDVMQNKREITDVAGKLADLSSHE